MARVPNRSSAKTTTRATAARKRPVAAKSARKAGADKAAPAARASKKTAHDDEAARGKSAGANTSAGANKTAGAKLAPRKAKASTRAGVAKTTSGNAARKTASAKTAAAKTKGAQAKSANAKSVGAKSAKANSAKAKSAKANSAKANSAKAKSVADAKTAKAKGGKGQNVKAARGSTGKVVASKNARREATKPKTAAPKTTAVKTAAPKTAAPKTAARKTAAFKTAARKAAAPKTAAPKTAAPKTAAPKTAAPKNAAPKTAAPKTAAPKTAAPKTAAPKNVKPAARARRSANPFLRPWPTGSGDLPPFDAISASHYEKAFRAAMAAHRDEVEAILSNPQPPSFANTVRAMECAGRLLDQVSAVFWNLVSADADAAMQALERAVAPELAQHSTAITLDPRLFQRVDALWENRDALGLDAEEARVLERTHRGLVRGGARLDAAAKGRVAAIVERLASLTATFMQNVMKDEQDWRLLLDESDLAGLPDVLRAAAKRAAQDAGHPDKWAITLARSSVEGFLTFSARRDLRERAFKAWIARGAGGGESDNTQVLAEVVALRGEYARLMGFEDFARFNLDDAMARSPEAVDDLLQRVWRPALARAAEEREALREQALAMGDDGAVEAWDWRYYAEKLRAARYDFDAAELRPYLSLDAMIAAAFAAARRLFGLSFAEIADAPRYHRDVRVWSVTDAQGAPVGLFLGDYFARPGKRSGAWMSSFRTQHKLDGEVRPIIVNVMNFARGGQGEPTLLSFDDARTLFHEFGHALHGLLSNVVYPSIAGTAVARDFVELPSQLYEHWLETPEILGAYARHVETGAPLPQELMDKLKAARDFNQGFATVEYTSSALVDMALYRERDTAGLDVLAFEARVLERIGMPREIVMRHRLPHFMHIVSGYAAGYYSYMWSEVMDADAFEAFRETGDVFDPETAARLRRYIYSAGDSRDPAESWRLFRGRAPSVEGLLRKRGLAA